MSRAPAGLVLDHTALLLLGRGHRFLSGLVAAPAHGQPTDTCTVTAEPKQYEPYGIDVIPLG